MFRFTRSFGAKCWMSMIREWLMTCGSYEVTSLFVWLYASAGASVPGPTWSWYVVAKSTPFVLVLKPLVKYWTVPPAPTYARSASLLMSAWLAFDCWGVAIRWGGR